MEYMGSLREEPRLKAQLLRQIRTAEGHLAGIRKMVEGDQYCVDILKQIAAVQGILSGAARALARSHTRHCVRRAIEEGKGEVAIDELFEALKYLKHF
ncbi:metal-sensitive transcriptional regulator [Candidatus Bipolaricaulota bacterium]|nr:metal-sensitive transcriptional regulator [Candidatus Bipolaricaulota bacterium]